MAVKDILNGEKGRRKILKGVNKLADTVGCTMGYGGRLVIINKGELRGTHATKDGVSVAQDVVLEDKFENMGANIVYQAAKATADVAGDGTTTSIVLARKMIKDGFALIKNDKYNLTNIKNGMNLACQDICSQLDKNTVSIKNDIEKMKQIATISANGSEDIGTLVSNAIYSSKADDVVISKKTAIKDHFTREEGYRFDGGLYSHHFESKQGTNVADYRNAKTLIVNGYLSNLRDIQEILITCRDNNTPLIIFAEEVNQKALTGLAMNNVEGNMSVAVVHLPDAGDMRKYSIKDLALATHSKVVDKNLDIKLSDITYEDLGDVYSIKSSMETTSLVFNKKYNKEIKELGKKLKESLNKKDIKEDPVRTDHIKKRLKRFSKGVASIHLSANTEVEFREKYDRVEDSVKAVLSAKEGGYIKGGGIGLIETLIKTHPPKKGDKSFKKGYNLVMESCIAPLYQILRNGGYNNRKVNKMVRRVLKDKCSKGYNLQSQKYTDLIKEGVIDPTKVTKTALRNAVSVSGIILTSDSFMVNHTFN